MRAAAVLVLDAALTVAVGFAGLLVADATAGAACTSTIATHTDASFSGSTSFVTQAGFQQSEIGAASYVLTAGAFPARIDTLEMLFSAQNTTETTTTRWSALVYRGLPSTGTLVATFSSNGGSIPHLVFPPGANARVLRIAVDPGSPLIVSDDGSHTFSIGFRVDAHHSPPSDSCAFAPPATRNAFPTTDVSGLAHPADNWIRGVNCGPSGCPANGGWARFSQLPAFCRPSGDWIMRAVYRPGVAASETPGATCADGIDNDCDGFRDCADGDCATDTACTPVGVRNLSLDGVRLTVTNPFVAGSGRIELTLPAAARMRVDIVDLAGRSIARLADGELGSGTHALGWDGRKAGDIVPAGLLFVRVRGERGGWAVRRFALIR